MDNTRLSWWLLFSADGTRQHPAEEDQRESRFTSSYGSEAKTRVAARIDHAAGGSHGELLPPLLGSFLQCLNHWTLIAATLVIGAVAGMRADQPKDKEAPSIRSQESSAVCHHVNMAALHPKRQFQSAGVGYKIT